MPCRHSIIPSTLIRRRAEIAGRIECHKGAVNQLILDLADVDHTQRLLALDIDLEEIEPKLVPPRN